MIMPVLTVIRKPFPAAFVNAADEEETLDLRNVATSMRTEQKG